MSWYRNYTACLKVTNPPPALIADVGRPWGSHPGVPDGRPNRADEVLGTHSLDDAAEQMVEEAERHGRAGSPLGSFLVKATIASSDPSRFWYDVTTR